MTLDKKIQLMLESEEGRKRRLYQCSAGKWTIGIGHNIEDRGLSDAAIDLIFLEDVGDSLTGLRNIFGRDFDSFSESQQMGLINLMFQLGFQRFNAFEKMIAAIKDKDWTLAAAELQDSLYYHQMMKLGNHRPERIIDLFLERDWPYKEQ